MVDGGLGEGKMENNCLIGMEFPFGVMKTFWNCIEVVVARHCGHTKYLFIVDLGMVNFMVYASHLISTFFFKWKGVM